MTPLFAHRAAEEFDRALEGRASPSGAERHADLLGTVETLRRMPQVEARADFVADLRTRLMTAAETDLVPAPPVARRAAPTRTPAAPARRRLGTVAASLVIVGGTAGMAAAASGALPGESLYPVKRGVEDISTAAHVGDASKGRALLDQARTRLDEAQKLQEGPDDGALVAEALQDFRTTANDGADRLFRAYADGSDHGDITSVRDFTTSGMEALAGMGTDKATADDVLQSADTLAQLDEQARGLCQACGSSAPVTVPLTLASSLGAADLDGLLSRPVTQAAADISAMKADLAAERAKLRALGRAAENTAGSIPQPGAGGSTTAASPSTPDPGQVTSTITPGGDVVTNLATTGTSAVKGLTQEVTGAVKATTKTGTPVDGVVSGVTDVTDEAVDALDGATQDLLRP